MKEDLNIHAQRDDSLAIEEIGNNHYTNSIDTPLNKKAFDLPNEEKMELISDRFREIMETLGLDLNDDSLQGTPNRVAKMFVKEIFYGLDPKNKPGMTLFDNKFQYQNMIVEINIPVYSTCEHHFLPIRGKAHVAYFSSGKVIGLSKLNRIVEYYAKRPQVQERLTKQIADEFRQVLETKDVAVYIEAEHFCVQSRGIRHENCLTITSDYSGKFLSNEVKTEFLNTFGK